MPSAATPKFDNDTKPVDRDRPFHRIHYKDFDTGGTKQKPDGIGSSCGCTNSDDFPDRKQWLDPEHFVDQEIQNEILKSLFGGFTRLMDALSSLGGIFPLETVILKAVKDLFDNIVEKLLPKALRAIPSWSPVVRNSSNESVDASQVVEVEGFVTRCYQNASDVPFFQWHHWYNWSIHIRPESGYDWVAADVSNPPSTKDFDDDNPEDDDNMNSDEHPITQNRSIECQWDPGALYQDRSMFDVGIPVDIDNSRLDQRAEKACGPMFGIDWAWPMASQYAWAAGRWVYDCGKSTEPKEDHPKDKPKNCTMINPCKAIATARWEAFRFPENDGAVPAIQFMFFACKRGGYIDHAGISDVDYEFIVDLPDIPAQRTAPFPIGHTEVFPDDVPPRFPHNTIVLRPRLLKHFNTGAFHVAGGGDAPPIVDVLPPDDPSQPPKQVKVTIPLSTMTGADAYGVIVSLGWQDPLNEQAQKVRVCTLNVSGIIGRKITRNDPDKDIAPLQDALISALADAMANLIPILPDPIKAGISKIIEKVLHGLTLIAGAISQALFAEGEKWLVRVGVNGRWFAFFRLADSNKEVPVSLGAKVQIFVGEHDRISISVSGGEIDNVGRVMFKARKDRLLSPDDKTATWKQIAESTKDSRKKLFIEYVLSLIDTLGLDNEPLGFIDAQIDPALHVTDYAYQEQHDPIWMDEQSRAFGANLSKLTLPLFGLTAKHAHSVGGPQFVYVEDDDQDYIVDCDLTVDKQFIPDN
jgi:hypothetical protein